MDAELLDELDSRVRSQRLNWSLASEMQENYIKTFTLLEKLQHQGVTKVLARKVHRRVGTGVYARFRSVLDIAERQRRSPWEE